MFRFKPLLLASILTLAACAPLQRGVSGDALVSGAKPPVSITAPTMTPVVAGIATPQLYTELGFKAPRIFYRLYAPAGGPSQAQAVGMIAEVPEGWQWSLDLSVGLHSVDKGNAAFGGRDFEAATYIVEAADDAFAALPQNAGKAPERWLARRFTRLEEFRKIKIVLEYREPLPAAFAGGLPTGGSGYEQLSAFAERAQGVFAVTFGPTSTQVDDLRTAEGVSQRGFVGLAGRMEPDTRYLFTDDK